jgi:hypothetical protein
MLELINRARADPAGEAARFGIDLNADLPPGTISAEAKAPLVMNDLLIDAGRSHSTWMLETDTFSHVGWNGSSPTDRMAAAGYVFVTPWTASENVSVKYTTASLPSDLTSYILDQHEGLFLSSGHRTNILGESFREVGIGQSLGVFTTNGTDFNASMITQDFALSTDTVFLGGVVYADADGDGFYSPGEGLAGVAVSAGGQTTQTTGSGGYQMPMAPGAHTVTFSGGGLTAPVTRAVTIDADNVKVDVVAGAAEPAEPTPPQPVIDTGSNDGAYNIFRFFNADTSVHFYTASLSEAQTVQQALPHFTYEGNAFDSDATPENGTAIYRFFNTESQTHFYTSSAQERDQIIDTLPHYTYEGIAYYAYEQNAADRMALYRFYNPETGAHFYTASADEKQDLETTSTDFVFERIAYYVDIA